jgi:hypothetical protein
MRWKEGKLVWGEIRADRPGPCKLRWAGKTAAFSLGAGQKLRFTGDLAAID